MSEQETPDFAALLAEAVEAYRMVEAMAIWMGMSGDEFSRRWQAALATPPASAARTEAGDAR